MRLWLIQQPLYRCCGRTNPCCKACRWSSKCPSNIHQAREGSAACKRRWNRGGRSNHFAPWPTTFSLTAAAVSSDADQARRISEDNVKKKKERKCILSKFICVAKIERVGLVLTSVWTMRDVCVHVSALQLHAPSPLLTCRAVRGEILSPSTAMATTCKSPWTGCTVLQHQRDQNSLQMLSAIYFG